jgi:hypothetical protein
MENNIKIGIKRKEREQFLVPQNNGVYWKTERLTHS